MTNPVERHEPSGQSAHRGNPRMRSRWLAGIAIVVVLGVHAWLSIRLFPSWRALTSDEPAISVDHAIHLYHGYLGARFIREHGTSWGYDPFFMAGYPKTPVYDSSSGPAELFQLLAGATYSPRAYKIGVVVLVWLGLACVVGASLASGVGPWPTVAASALGLWYWWVGYPGVLVRTGLVAFVWASALAALVPMLLVRFGREPRLAMWTALAGAVALGIQAHGMFPLLIFVPTAVGYISLTARATNRAGGRRMWAWYLAGWGALLVALAATRFWWWPLLRFLPLKTSSELFMKAQYWSFFVEYYWLHDGRLPLLILLFGLVGLVDWWRSGRRVEALVLTSQIGMLSGLTFAGSLWSVTRNLEPLRFQVPLGLAWCVVAGQGICTVARCLVPRQSSIDRHSSATRQRGTGGQLPRWRVGLVCRIRQSKIAGALVPSTQVGSMRAIFRWIGAAMFLILVGLLTTPIIWQFSRFRLETARPVAVGLRPEMKELVAWIKQNTDTSARILFEDQLRLWEATEPESLHWTPLLPLLTGREFVGGLYHLAFIPHRRAAFGDWHLAERHIREWSPDGLRAFCEQYNIGWVITWSRASPRKEGGLPLSTDVFASLPFCELIATMRRHTGRNDENLYSIFRLHRKSSFFARGRGRVTRVDYNRIELADLEPEANLIVLRYHWQDGFQSDPPLPIERVQVQGDPVGFIGLKTHRPVPVLVLENAYR